MSAFSTFRRRAVALVATASLFLVAPPAALAGCPGHWLPCDQMPQACDAVGLR